MVIIFFIIIIIIIIIIIGIFLHVSMRGCQKP